MAKIFDLTNRIAFVVVIVGFILFSIGSIISASRKDGDKKKTNIPRIITMVGAGTLTAGLGIFFIGVISLFFTGVN